MCRFIVDHNVGKLAKWLRMMGYDAALFTDKDDARMIDTALKEGRIVLTRDTQVMERGVIAKGRIKGILITSDDPTHQIAQVAKVLKLHFHHPFSICMECNQPLVTRRSEEVEGRVPPYVFKTQKGYMECPSCGRIYWRGTHWQHMREKLSNFVSEGLG